MEFPEDGKAKASSTGMTLLRECSWLGAFSSWLASTVLCVATSGAAEKTSDTRDILLVLADVPKDSKTLLLLIRAVVEVMAEVVDILPFIEVKAARAAAPV